MSISQKYERTYHFPFSPGTSSDDRINHDYWQDVKNLRAVVHTEKLDGENNCLNRHGVFARSHASPTTSAWTQFLRQRWEHIKNDLGDIEIFGENLYAIHSIEYRRIEDHYFVFAIRQDGIWKSWEEVKFWSAMFDFPTVPELKIISPKDETSFRSEVIEMAAAPSSFDSFDVALGKPCSREGVVSRNVQAFSADDFKSNVFKYVRKGHVKTDEHWTKNWKRARLHSERSPLNDTL